MFFMKFSIVKKINKATGKSGRRTISYVYVVNLRIYSVKKELFCYRIGKSQKISSHSKTSDKICLYIVAAQFILFKNVYRTPCPSSLNFV